MHIDSTFPPPAMEQDAESTALLARMYPNDELADIAKPGAEEEALAALASCQAALAGVDPSSYDAEQLLQHNNLACLELAYGDTEKAERMLRSCVAGYTERWGAAHLITLRARTSYAYLLQDAAEDLAQQGAALAELRVLARRVGECWGPASLEGLNAQAVVAEQLDKMDQNDEAIALLQDILTAARKSPELGAGNSQTQVYADELEKRVQRRAKLASGALQADSEWVKVSVRGERGATKKRTLYAHQQTGDMVLKKPSEGWRDAEEYLAEDGGVALEYLQFHTDLVNERSADRRFRQTAWLIGVPAVVVIGFFAYEFLKNFDLNDVREL